MLFSPLHVFSAFFRIKRRMAGTGREACPATNFTQKKTNHMKKVLIILALACGISHAAMSQQATYKVEGNTYKAVTKTTPKRDSTITAYTYETNGKAYAICLSKNGSAYVGRVSSRTGRYYRQYLGEAISRDICGKTGKEYKGKGKISK